MVQNKSGVIMTVIAPLSRMRSRLNGGYGPEQAVKEALIRDLSAELAPEDPNTQINTFAKPSVHCPLAGAALC
jgi:hypothetical protein